MTRLNPTAAVGDPIPVLGIGTTPLVPESDAVLDELVFEAVSAALAEAGVRKHELGLSVTASMDVYDGRSISCGLTNAASGGYLAESYRIEGDAGQAIIAAAQSIAAGDADLALAVAVYNPEVSAPDRRAFLQQISNYSFEPHFDRPVALTSDTVLGLHTDYVLRVGDMTEGAMAELAASLINRGNSAHHTLRGPTNAAEVSAAPLVNGILTELMLPAEATGAVAVVLGSLARARRSLHPRAILTGWGQGTSDTTASSRWLSDPGMATQRAAREAYARAHVRCPAEEVGVVELTAATPALFAPMLSALELSGTTADVSPSGGVACCYPGLANGGLRLLGVVSWLERASAADRQIGVAHATELLSGSIADTSTVLVLEKV